MYITLNRQPSPRVSPNITPPTVLKLLKSVLCLKPLHPPAIIRYLLSQGEEPNLDKFPWHHW